MALIYYLLDATRRSQRVKIGTTTNLAARIKAVKTQTSSGQCPTLLALEEGSFEVERERHERFAACRLSGEWFDYDPAADVVVANGQYGEAAQARLDLYRWICELENPMAFIMDREHLWPDASGWNGLPYITQAAMVTV